MDYKISDEALHKTKKCPLKMQCLTESNRPKCKAKGLIKGCCVFIRTSGSNPCPYKISFGYGYICNCPTRYELYERYKL